MKKILNQFASNPKQLFLIDGFGAFLTALILWVISTTCNEYFGVPKRTLGILSNIAFVFGIYDVCCFFWARKMWRPFLRLIIIANLLYCCLTLGLVICNFTQLSILGVTYFLLEIAIVSGLVFFEIKVFTMHLT